MSAVASSRSSGDEFRFYEQDRDMTMHSAIGELLFYVRKRTSGFRPYLSGGVGTVTISSAEGQVVSGSADPPTNAHLTLGSFPPSSFR